MIPPGLLTARDVPEIRADMTRWARDRGPDGATNWFTFFLGPRPRIESPVIGSHEDAAAIIASRLTTQLPAAELFYVSADMAELARHAAITLTDYRLYPEDLPAPVGLMVYEQPPVPGTATDRLNGRTLVTWGPGTGGLWVHTWATPTAEWCDDGRRLGRGLARIPHEEALRRAEHAATYDLPEPDHQASLPHGLDPGHYALGTMLPQLRRAPIPPSFDPAHGYFWCGLKPMEFTDMDGWPHDIASHATGASAEAEIALERTILATWLLMGQTITRSDTVTAARAARRRIARDQPDLSAAVRYTDLRRARTVTADNSGNPDTPPSRDYRHRWVVRGHWRNQYYPSRNDHRPIWIAPHLAGPDDKPLLGGDRVNVLRR